MELYNVVTKLVGPIQATGDHGEDCRRLINIKVMIELVDRLIFDLDSAAVDAGRHEQSMKDIGCCAKTFMDELRNSFS